MKQCLFFRELKMVKFVYIVLNNYLFIIHQKLEIRDANKQNLTIVQEINQRKLKKQILIKNKSNLLLTLQIEFWIDLVLTLFGYLPGIVYAVYVLVGMR